MDSPLRLALIYGSTREGRFCDKVAEWAIARIAPLDDLALDVIDPAALGLPSRHEREAGPAVQELRRRLAEADAFVVVTPEYNHGYPAALKFVIDLAGAPWRAKPVGFVATGKWRPRADVYETEDSLVVRVDIAGVDANEIKVELADGVITIAGERRPIREGKPQYHAMEVQVGPFERRLRLPTPVDPKSLKASYEHGMLEVRLTKVPERRTGTHAVKVQ